MYNSTAQITVNCAMNIRILTETLLFRCLIPLTLECYGATMKRGLKLQLFFRQNNLLMVCNLLREEPEMWVKRKNPQLFLCIGMRTEEIRQNKSTLAYVIVREQSKLNLLTIQGNLWTAEIHFYTDCDKLQPVCNKRNCRKLLHILYTKCKERTSFPSSEGK